MRKLKNIRSISNALWYEHFPDDYDRLNKILSARIQYMERKAGEFSEREIDGNEF